MHKLILSVSLSTLALMSSMNLQAEVKVAKVFSPHMVLQREMPVPIWGTAAPGETVSVSFRDQSKTIEADKDGKWRILLAPLKAGGPDVLKIGAQSIDDVLVGEVWVGSGQSNMDMVVKSYTEGDPELAKRAAATYPKLRLLRKGANDRWEESTPETNTEFSALLFSFGQSLQAELNVPVGVMVGAVGGTPSGFWLSEEMFKQDAACQEMVKKMAPSYDYEGLKSKYEAEKTVWDAQMVEWKKLEAAAKAEGKQPSRAPAGPKPAGRAGEVNSGKMGQLFESFIRPYVGYAIRGVLWDQGESRTNVACVDQYTLMGALIKGWRKDWGQDFAFLYVQKPSGGGTSWDPSNPLTSKSEKFAPQPPALPREPETEYSQELHLRIMNYPNTFMVTSTDLGAGTHPVLKSSYGQRSAYVALGAVYGAKHEIYGPLFASSKVEGGKMRVQFSHTGKGLAARHSDKLQGFLIAGSDRQFKWAEAVIDGQSIVVSSPDVPKPEAVRYAWSQTFPWANLFNQDGLPAQPFRTDSW